MYRFARFIALVLLIAFFFACSAKQPVNDRSVKILIPLYSYPTWYNSETYFWKQVTEAANRVSITAIINPNNGPDGGAPNKDYAKGLDDLRSANVTILGYIFTNYGKRNLAEVKADIDLYDRYYNIDGIFFDEAASSADKLNYYQELYNYTKTKPNLEIVVSNQGTQTDEGYLKRSAADTIVLFENYAREWQSYQIQSYVKGYGSDRFSCLIHTVPDAATMRKYIDLAAARNIQYVYITDDSPDDRDRDPWNRLPSYWQEEVDYIQSLTSQ